MIRRLIILLLIWSCEEAGLNTNSLTNGSAVTDTLYIAYDTTIYIYDTTFTQNYDTTITINDTTFTILYDTTITYDYDTTFTIYDTTIVINDTLIIYQDNDCAGVVGGGAFIDDCSQCVGGTTGLLENYLQDDCGVCGGNNECVDNCNAPNGDNSTCTGCIDSSYDNYCSDCTISCTNCCANMFDITIKHLDGDVEGSKGWLAIWDFSNEDPIAWVTLENYMDSVIVDVLTSGTEYRAKTGGFVGAGGDEITFYGQSDFIANSNMTVYIPDSGLPPFVNRDVYDGDIDVTFYKNLSNAVGQDWHFRIYKGNTNAENILYTIYANAGWETQDYYVIENLLKQNESYIITWGSLNPTAVVPTEDLLIYLRSNTSPNSIDYDDTCDYNDESVSIYGLGICQCSGLTQSPICLSP